MRIERHRWNSIDLHMDRTRCNQALVLEELEFPLDHIATVLRRILVLFIEFLDSFDDSAHAHVSHCGTAVPVSIFGVKTCMHILEDWAAFWTCGSCIHIWMALLNFFSLRFLFALFLSCQSFTLLGPLWLFCSTLYFLSYIWNLKCFFLAVFFLLIFELKVISFFDVFEALELAFYEFTGLRCDH